MNKLFKNSWPKQSWKGLFVALFSFFNGVEGKQLSPALTQAMQEIQTGLSTKPTVSSAPAGAESDKFVQSEAHLQVREVQEKLAHIELHVNKGDDDRPNWVQDSRSSNELVTPYLNVTAAIVNKEVELKDSHYVFYNGCGNEWRVAQDINNQLYAYRNPLKSIKDFVFVRFTNSRSINAQDFLRESVAEWSGVNDNIQSVRELLVATNLSLYGGVGMQGECTWNYFLTAKSHRYPTATQYYDVLKSNDISYDLEAFTQEATVLVKELCDASAEQMLVQYCIPQDRVDETAYLAWILGFPYHPKSVALMEERLEGKVRTGKVTGKVVKKMMEAMRESSQYKHLNQELKEAVENGDFGVSAFMNRYRNEPWTVHNINDIQARVLVTNDIILNPDSGVKIFRYFTTPRDIQANYLKKLDALVKKIIDQENSKTSAQKSADMAKNEKTFKKLKAEQQIAWEKSEAEKGAQKKQKIAAKNKN